MDYSGAWQAKTFNVPLQLSHGILPADEAITCQECHTSAGRLDFAGLGYSEEDVALLTSLSSPDAGQPKTLQVKVAPRAEPLPETSLEEPPPPAPKALEIPWTPAAVILIIAVVIAIVLYLLLRLKKEVNT